VELGETEGDGDGDGDADGVGEVEGLGETIEGDGAGDVPAVTGVSPPVPATGSLAIVLRVVASPVGTLAAAAATAGKVHRSSLRIGV
jgi:hypothetical protein